MKWILSLSLFLLSSCAAQPMETAFVSLAENARQGGMQITAIDGEPVSSEEGLQLPVGPHEVSVACKLDNGISMTFDFDVELKPSHSYCFYSRDQGQACTILYAEVGWTGSGVLRCR